MSLSAKPISLKEANVFVERFHRHSIPTVGGKFALSVYTHTCRRCYLRSPHRSRP